MGRVDLDSGTCSHCGKFISRGIWEHVKLCRREVSEAEYTLAREQLAELISTIEPPPNSTPMRFVVTERSTITYEIHVPDDELDYLDDEEWFWENVKPEHEVNRVKDTQFRCVLRR